MCQPEGVDGRAAHHLPPGDLQPLVRGGTEGAGEELQLTGGDPRVCGGAAVDQQVEQEAPHQPSTARHVEGEGPTSVQPGLTQPGGEGEGEDGGGGDPSVGEGHERCSLLGRRPHAEQVVQAGEGQSAGKALAR